MLLIWSESHVVFVLQLSLWPLVFLFVKGKPGLKEERVSLSNSFNSLYFVFTRCHFSRQRI